MLNQKSFGKKKFEINAQGQKCKNGYVAKNSHYAILAILSLCFDFKNFFGQMTYFLVIWKTYYILLLSASGPVQSRPCAYLKG